MKSGRKLRWKDSWIELREDGTRYHERIKGFTKRHLTKWAQKKIAKEHFRSYEEEI